MQHVLETNAPHCHFPLFALCCLFFPSVFLENFLSYCPINLFEKKNTIELYKWHLFYIHSSMTFKILWLCVQPKLVVLLWTVVCSLYHIVPNPAYFTAGKLQLALLFPQLYTSLLTVLGLALYYIFPQYHLWHVFRLLCFGSRRVVQVLDSFFGNLHITSLSHSPQFSVPLFSSLPSLLTLFSYFVDLHSYP